MATVVISVGGSIILQDLEDIEFLTKLAGLLRELSKSHKIYIVVGGGKTSRDYIKLTRKLGTDEASLDEIGIDCTRINARVMIAALGPVYANPYPVKTIEEVLSVSSNYPIVVMGGTQPGHTTDAVAVTLAERVGAERFINATSVDGVYTMDPKLDPNAKKLDKITPAQLIETILKSEQAGAGPHIVIDILASKLIERSRIPTLVVDGRDLDALKNAVEGKDFNGTIIASE